MEKATSEYREKCLIQFCETRQKLIEIWSGYLLKIPKENRKRFGLPEKIITLKKEHETYPKYIEAVKTIIDYGHDAVNGFVLEFNSDYSKLKIMFIKIKT